MQVNTPPTRWSHFGNIGDCIASLPALRQHYRNHGIKPTLYLVKDYPAIYYEGATHPTKNDKGEQVSLNQQVCEMLAPLIKAQDYIEDVKIISSDEYYDNDIQINLSAIRNTYCGIPNFQIQRWYFYVYPDLACDLSEQYIFLPENQQHKEAAKIVISRSERYTNPQADYSFLKEFEDDCIFIGTMREYNNFCINFDLNIRKVNVSDFLEYAQILAQSRFHISNQTMAFQISEGMKIPRIVELCSYAPNVVPIGENAYDFFSTEALEYYFFKLNGQLDEYVKRKTQK